MTEFELLAIPISLVLGLGITKILSGATNAIRDRKETTLHWFPLSWAFLIFLFQIQYFFVIWDLNEMGDPWTWARFGPPLLNSILLYLAASLILPGQRRSTVTSLMADFDEHGRLALIPLALMLIVAIPLNMLLYDTQLFDKANGMDVVLVTLVFVVWITFRRPWQFSATALFAVIESYAVFYVWAMPGN